MPEDLDDLSAIDRVIFLWVWESVEWGRKDSLVLKTAWPWRPDTVTGKLAMIYLADVYTTYSR
jgi:hypothetical protein